MFHIRASQAHSNPSQFSGGFVTYQQISFGMGFILIAIDTARLSRCLLVNATYGPEKYYSESPAAAATKVVPPQAPSADTPDQPRARSSYRWAFGFLGLAFTGTLVTGIIANSNYSKDIDSQANADLTANARFVLYIFLGI